VKSALFRGFALRLTLKGCSGGESLTTCGRFDRLDIWTYPSRTKSKRLTTCVINYGTIWIDKSCTDAPNKL